MQRGDTRTLRQNNNSFIKVLLTEGGPGEEKLAGDKEPLPGSWVLATDLGGLREISVTSWNYKENKEQPGKESLP